MGRRRCTSRSSRLKSSYSSQSFVLQDENLLTLILLHVPRTKLIVLKYVSRQWRSLITNPHFLSLLSPLPDTSLFIQHPSADHSKFYSLPLDYPDTPFPIRTCNFAHDHSNDPVEIEILSSCNGLLLCSTRQFDYYVYNTSTGELASLREHPRHAMDGIRYAGLAFDPSKSLHYKVVVFVMSQPLCYDVDDFYIYSSDTETWKASAQSLNPIQGMHLVGGVYWNGCVHWLGQYSSSQCFYFNVDEERLKTFPRPPMRPRIRSYLGESEDHLYYAQVCPDASSFNVYEMKRDHSEWFVKYHIDLDPIFKAFPKMNSSSKDHRSSTGESYYNAAVASIIRRENFMEDSFLILELPGKIIRYNLVDGSFKVIWDFVVLSFWSCGDYKAWPYFE